MVEVLEILKSIGNTNSRNDKEYILQQNKDNEIFKKVLQYTYSDNLQYGFSEKKLREMLSKKPRVATKFTDGFEMLDELASSNINDSLREDVIGFILSKEPEEQELWIKILTKDLRCNISTKTINKAIPKLITQWEIQQAYPIDKAKLKKNEWICLSLKLNGIRSTCYKNTFRSRQNKEMLGYSHIESDINAIDWLKDYVVDGEMIRKNIDNVPDNENFRLTTSIVNSDMENKSEIEMVIFDLIPINDFIRGESSKGFKDRLKDLERLQSDIDKLGLKNIRIAPVYYTGTNHSQIENILDKVDSEGYEGLMCLRDDKYKTKRHKGILKVKKFKTADCEIIGYEEGEGKYKGVLGSFIINYKNSKVNVGSGYTDMERTSFWEHRHEYIGRILEVKYKEESKDSKTGLVSLQFPTFVTIRELNKEVSYN